MTGSSNLKWRARTNAAMSAVLLVIFVTSTHAASVLGNGESLNDGTPWSESLSRSWLVGIVLASAAVVICGVLLIMGCTDLCQRHSGFKDFDNDAFNTDDNLTPVPTPSEFTMYPPIENTPDSLSTSPVVFEPLPDIAIRSMSDQGGGRVRRIRPRVTQEAYERSESVDSLDDVPYRDNVQEKIKLQNLLTNSRQQVPRGQLQYIKEMGNGWFGKILQGEGHGILPGHRKTKVVIQMLKEEPDSQDQLAFLEEALPYRDTDHANVVKLLGQCVDTVPYLNILELCPFGDLKTYLRSHRVAMESFNEKGLLLKFACDMAAGLQALHQEGFVHRDFATRNCMLASDLSVKVGDYGLSEEAYREDYYQDSYGDALPIRWLAPESLLVTQEEVAVKRITKEVNVWAYGVTLWEILTFGSLPYGDLTNNHVLRLVVLERSVRLPKPDVVVSNLDRLYQLMQLCWSEPEHRPSLRELRIMLLHLLSRKDDHSSAAFDHKWNQLMPRRSPRVTRVADSRFGQTGGLQANGSIHTVAGALPLNGNKPSRPSVLSEDGMDDDNSNLAQLNVSKLGLAGSRGSLNKDEVPSNKTKELTSPVNEKSLEAEFSAANVAAASKDEERDREINIQIHTPSQKQAEVNGILDEDEDIFSPIKSDASENAANLPEILSDTQPNSTAGTGDQVVPNGVSTLSPDVVINAPSDKPSMDFMTSTPKKAEPKTPDTDLYTTAGGGTSEISTERSGVTPTYHTAQSFSSQSSTERSLSMDIEDRSFMAPKKFADMLQTVAMTPSIDDEMVDTSNENSPFPSDFTEEDVFRSAASNLQGTNTGQMDDVMHNLSFEESTPRNTPTPPLATSSAPLLELTGPEVRDDGEHAGIEEVEENRQTPQLATSAVPLLEVSEISQDMMADQSKDIAKMNDSRDTDTPTPPVADSPPAVVPDSPLEVVSGSPPAAVHVPDRSQEMETEEADDITQARDSDTHTPPEDTSSVPLLDVVPDTSQTEEEPRALVTEIAATDGDKQTDSGLEAVTMDTK